MFRACLRLFKNSTISPQLRKKKRKNPRNSPFPTKEKQVRTYSTWPPTSSPPLIHHQNPPNCAESARSPLPPTHIHYYHLHPMNGMPMHETVLLSVSSRPRPGRAAPPKVPIDPACRTFFHSLPPSPARTTQSNPHNKRIRHRGKKKIVCTIFI